MAPSCYGWKKKKEKAATCSVKHLETGTGGRRVLRQSYLNIQQEV
jgi:hypothetical protein